MADPLSITASIIAVLQLAGSVVGYLRDVEGASKDCRKLILEISSIRGILDTVKEIAVDVENSEAEQWSATIGALILPDGPVKRLESMLQELQNRLKQMDSAKGLKKLAKSLQWPFAKSETDNIIRAIERQKSLLALALDNNHLALSKAIKENTAVILSNLQNIQEDILSLQNEVSLMGIHQREMKDNSLLSWISLYNYKVSQNDKFTQRIGNTGAWLLNRPEYIDWLTGKQLTLFCPGIPGAGKSVISSLVVNDLLTRYRKEHNNVAVTWIYCNYKERSFQTALSLLSSILRQLLDLTPSLDKGLIDLHEECSKSGSSMKVDQCVAALKKEITKYEKVFVVVDALDECNNEDGTRTSFLYHLRSLGSNIYHFFTSRPIASIATEFETALRIQIDAHNEDIREYVQARVDSDPKLRNCVQNDTELSDLNENTVIERCHGMFLLARLHMDSLAKLARQSKAAVRRGITTLPKDLDKTYDEAFKRIMAQDNDDVLLAKHVISWVCFTLEPLNVSQLQQVLAIEQGFSEYNEEALIDSEYFISLCSGLIVLDQDSQIVRPVHYTALDYFVRHRLQYFPTSHLRISEVCVDKLLDFLDNTPNDSEPSYPYYCGTGNIFDGPYISKEMYNEDSNYCNSLSEEWQKHYGSEASKHFGQNSIKRYAVWNMVSHLKAAHDTNLIIKAKQLWDHSNLSLLDKAQQRIGNSNNKRQKKEALDRFRILSDLQYAVYFSWTSEVVRLLKNNPEKSTNSGPSSTWIATYQGDNEILLLLLEAGLSTEKLEYGFLEMPYERNALECAICENHPSTVSLIMTKRPEMRNFRGPDGRTALHTAARLGSVETVKLLLSNGFAVNAVTDEDRTPLHWAVGKAHYSIQRRLEIPDIVQALIDGGAAVNVKDCFRKTPLDHCSASNISPRTREILLKYSAVQSIDPQLIMAIKTGDIEAVETLLAQGADPNVIDEDSNLYNGTALCIAIQRDKPEIVNLLIVGGADIHQRNGQALRTAVLCRNEALIELLLAKNLDINACDEYGRTAFTLAYDMFRSFKDVYDETNRRIVNILLDHGANVNILDGGRSALLKAVHWGNLQDVEMLLDRGADANIGGSDSPIHAAAYASRLDIMEALLRHGATDVDRNKTALYFAAENGNMEMARLLVENRIDVNVPGGFWGTPLMAAISKNHCPMVEYLLANKADPNTACHGDTALMLASTRGSVEIVQRLLEARIDVNFIATSGTALVAAVKNGRIEVVKLLLQHGADVNAENNRAGTALFALRHGSEKTEEVLDGINALLKEYGGNEDEEIS